MRRAKIKKRTIRDKRGTKRWRSKDKLRKNKMAVGDRTDLQEGRQVAHGVVDPAEGLLSLFGTKGG